MVRPLALGFLSSLLVVGCTLDRSGLATGGGGNGGAPATTVTTSGGGMTSSSTGNPTTGGSNPGVENCLNGTDDDGDMLADCADPDCAPGFVCVPEEATADSYVSPLGTAAACPADAPARDLASCGTCDCTPQSGSCTLQGEVHINNTLNCGGTSVVIFDAPQNCNSAPSGDRSYNVSTSAPDNNGLCQPNSLTTPTNPATLCAASATGACASAGEVCVPAHNDACVLVNDSACPSTYPMQRAELVEGTATACQCGCDKLDETCSPTIEVSSNDGCVNAQTISLNAMGCTSLGNIESLRLPAQLSTVTCEARVTPPRNSNRQLLCCRN